MKLIKKLLCITITVLLCFSLIGCNVIDKMRDAQIHFNEKSELIYNDTAYKLLPACEAFSPNFTLNKNLYIVDKEIPVLLSEIYGNAAYLSKDEKFIQSANAHYINEYYARADIYDEIAQRINSGNYFDGFCFYFDYFDENDEIPSYKQDYKIISEEAEKAIKDIITSGIPDEEIDIDLMYQFEVTALFACSNDLLFKDYAATIYKTEKFIYIAADTGLEKAQVFKVGDENFEAINDLIDSYYSLQVDYNDYIIKE